MRDYSYHPDTRPSGSLPFLSTLPSRMLASVVIDTVLSVSVFGVGALPQVPSNNTKASVDRVNAGLRLS